MTAKTLTLRLNGDIPSHNEALKSLEYIKKTWNLKTDTSAIVMWLQMAQYKTESKHELELDLEALQAEYDELKKLLSEKISLDNKIKEFLND